MFKLLARLVVAVVAVSVLLASCASSDPQPETSDLPEWYLNPPSAEDAIYGVGSAKMSTLDASRRMALSRARNDIAFQMNAAIESAIIDYAQEAGVDGNNQVVNFVENISRQITETTLQGTQTEEIARGDDGTVYALISYPKNGFTEAASQAFSRNEDAAFAEFKADQALQALDAQLENNPPRAGRSGESDG